VTAPPGAVVLDLGNVVVRWDPYLPYVGRMERDAVDAFFDDVDFPVFNHQQDAGRSWADARAEVADRFPQHVDALDVYVTHFGETLPGPVPGTEAVVRDLLASGVRVLGLTNWSAETFHHAGRVAPAVGLLEGVLVSGEVGLAKPDPRIFELLARRFGLDPSGTVFADDSAPNVAAAAALGFDAVLFTSAARLRTDLVARGLDLPAA
jgi:2-haloacid dehalogenase